MKAKKPTTKPALEPARHQDGEITGFEAVAAGSEFIVAPGVKTMSGEQWVPCFLLRGYEVSNIGRVRNTKTGRLVNPKLDEEGYLQVTIQVPVHILVANSWLPNAEHFDGIKHKDGSLTHNHFLNLEFVPEENPHLID